MRHGPLQGRELAAYFLESIQFDRSMHIHTIAQSHTRTAHTHTQRSFGVVQELWAGSFRAVFTSGPAAQRGVKVDNRK